MIRCVFLGTPPAAVPGLEALHRIAEVAAVVTRPDKPRGRSGRPVASPVDEAARRLALPVIKPVSGGELEQHLAELPPLDVGVVVAFGMILSPAALSVPRAGFVNLHFSLLPRWRGAAPVERAILAGDSMTGVTMMRMEEGLDTGPILAKRHIPIDPDENAGELTGRLAAAGADLLERHLRPYVEGELLGVEQPAQGVTYAKRLTTAEASLRAATPAAQLLLAVRAYAPRPGARFIRNGETMKVWRAALAARHDLPAGHLLFDGEHLMLGTADQAITLLEVQPAGGRRMAGAAWARGRHGDLGSFA